MSDTLEGGAANEEKAADQTISRLNWVGWSSFFFAVVQSICTIFVALSGLRLLLGAAALAAAIGAMQVIGRIHADVIRIPMVMFALVGAVFNLVALWQVHRLRGREASAWRQRTLSRSKFASLGMQLALSLLTLILLGVETFFHLQINHHL